jgi:hypothetical protein
LIVSMPGVMETLKGIIGVCLADYGPDVFGVAEGLHHMDIGVMGPGSRSLARLAGRRWCLLRGVFLIRR